MTRFCKIATAWLAAITLISGNSTSLLAASDHAAGRVSDLPRIRSSQRGERSGDRAASLEAQWRRLDISRLPANARRHSERLQSLQKIGQLSSVYARRTALEAMGLHFERRGDGVTVFRLDGKEVGRIASAAPPQRQQRRETPDGASELHHESLEDLYYLAESDAAYYDATAAEWDGTASDIQAWINQNSTTDCAVDEGTLSGPSDTTSGDGARPSCLAHAFAAVANLVLNSSAVKALGQAARSQWNQCQMAWQNYESAAVAGSITWVAFGELTAGLVVDFVAGLNIGWVAGAGLVVGSGLVVWEYMDCMAQIIGTSSTTLVSER